MFLSYSRKGEDEALALAGALRRSGVRIWVDQLEIKGGDVWERRIAEALHRSSYVIVLLTHASVESDEVLAEALRPMNNAMLVSLSKACAVSFSL